MRNMGVVSTKIYVVRHPSGALCPIWKNVALAHEEGARHAAQLCDDNQSPRHCQHGPHTVTFTVTAKERAPGDPVTSAVADVMLEALEHIARCRRRDIDRAVGMVIGRAHMLLDEGRIDSDEARRWEVKAVSEGADRKYRITRELRRRAWALEIRRAGG